MKVRKIVVSLLVVNLILSLGAFAFAAQGNQGGKVLEALTDSEVAWMKFMREEEKLAHDVYVVMYELWGAPIFAQIATSESRHMDAVLGLLVKYGVEDPATGLGIGEFSNQDLQALYDELVAQGRVSLLEALKVGVVIEETDIDDLTAAIAETQKTDLQRVYGNLLQGSYNHLRAFESHL
jgi:hypothetical protein